jgi:hypothetical protein
MEAYRISTRHTNDPRSLQHPSVRRTAPWTHFVLDDFLDPNDFDAARDAVLGTHDTFAVQEGDPAQLEFALLRHLPLTKTLLASDTINLLQAVAGTRLRLNESNLLQLRRTKAGGPTLDRHIDTPLGGRSLVMLYYLSPGWTPAFGGRLRLHESQHAPDDEATYVEPVENRLVAFFTDPHCWHSVEPVADWERLSILAEWYCAEATD